MTTTETTGGAMLRSTTEKEEREAFREFAEKQRHLRLETQMAVQAARPALERLIDVMLRKTGQSYRIRALLYSLWSGKPTSLLGIVTLDHDLRKDFLAVCLAFGANEFFFDAIRRPIEAQSPAFWTWFVQEGGDLL
jgi:hypothetical protein